MVYMEFSMLARLIDFFPVLDYIMKRDLLLNSAVFCLHQIYGRFVVTGQHRLCNENVNLIDLHLC